MKFERPFPLKIDPFPDESLLGFIGRLMERNGYPSQGPLWEFVGVSKNAVAPEAIDRLAFVSKRSAEEIAGLFKRTAVGGFIAIGDQMVSERKLSSAPAFCLECFREAPYYRALWDIKWFAACPRHGCLLTRRCPTCRGTLQWDRRRFLECPKHHSLITTDENPSVLATWGIRAERAMQECLSYGMVHPESLPVEIGRLSLNGLIDLLNVLGGFGRWGYAELMENVGPTSFGRISRRLNRGFDCAAGWPATFHSHVRDQAAAAAGGGFGSARYLRAEIRRLGESDAGVLLREEFERALPDAGDIDIDVSDPPVDLDAVSLSDIATELGYSRKEISLVNRVDCLVESKRVKYFTKSFVPRSKFEDWKVQGKAWLKVSDVAARWKVKDVSLLEVCQDGLLGFSISKFVRRGSGFEQWRIRQREIDRFEELLQGSQSDGLAPPRTHAELGMSLSTLVRSIKVGTVTAYQWTHDQGLGQARFVGLDVGAEAGLVGRSHSTSFDAETPGRASKIELEVVATQLELSVSTVKQAYKDGFFGPVLRTNLTEMEASAVEAFRAKYVSPGVFAKERKVSSLNRVFRILREAEVRPANKPLEGFNRASWWGSRFYRRIDLDGISFSES